MSSLHRGSPFTVSSMRAIARSSRLAAMASHEKLRVVEIGDAPPLDASGNVLEYELREPAAAKTPSR